MHRTQLVFANCNRARGRGDKSSHLLQCFWKMFSRKRSDLRRNAQSDCLGSSPFTPQWRQFPNFVSHRVSLCSLQTTAESTWLCGRGEDIQAVPLPLHCSGWGGTNQGVLWPGFLSPRTAIPWVRAWRAPLIWHECWDGKFGCVLAARKS